MAKDPAFLFYSSDFLTGTMTMTNEQVGKYIRLLCLQHQRTELSEKDMLNICTSYDEDIFSKFEKTATGFFNVRLREEIEKRKAYTESRRKNRLDKTKEHMLNTSLTYDKHMENENENKDEVINKDKGVKKSKFKPDYSICPEWMVAPLKLWIQHKAEKNQSYKETGFAMLVSELKKDYPDGKGFFDAVRKSISKNYAGIFPADKQISQTYIDPISKPLSKHENDKSHF
jgi:predicted HicB family RNase H-like nuclease